MSYFVEYIFIFGKNSNLLIYRIYQKLHVNYSELFQFAKGWGNFVSDRINIWRLLTM